MPDRKKKAPARRRYLPATSILFPDKKKRPKAVEHADYLSLLHRTKNKKKLNQLVDYASRDQIDAISEVTENVLRGVLVLNQIQQERLKKYKKCLRLLAARNTSIKRKKEQLRKYSGGFLPALLGAAIPAIGGILSGLFGNP